MFILYLYNVNNNVDYDRDALHHYSFYSYHKTRYFYLYIGTIRRMNWYSNGSSYCSGNWSKAGWAASRKKWLGTKSLNEQETAQRLEALAV